VENLPEFNQAGDLPEGAHSGSLDQIVRRFGESSARRKTLANRLRRVHRLAMETGHLSRFIVFGSFITAQPVPNDIDVFLLMDDDFEVSALVGEAAMLFDHSTAQTYFGASVFWLRRRAALGGEQSTIEYWQIRRDGRRRGIMEVVPRDSE
jgi:hypothetical protein